MGNITAIKLWQQLKYNVEYNYEEYKKTSACQLTQKGSGVIEKKTIQKKIKEYLKMISDKYTREYTRVHRRTLKSYTTMFEEWNNEDIRDFADSFSEHNEGGNYSRILVKFRAWIEGKNQMEELKEYRNWELKHPVRRVEMVDKFILKRTDRFYIDRMYNKIASYKDSHSAMWM